MLLRPSTCSTWSFVCMRACEYDSRSHDLPKTLQNNSKRPPCARPEKKRNSLIYIFSLYVYIIYLLLLYDYIRFRDTVVVIVGLMIVTRHYPRVWVSPTLLWWDTRQWNHYYYLLLLFSKVVIYSFFVLIYEFLRYDRRD